MSLHSRIDRTSTPRRRETTGGSLGSNTSARNQVATRSNSALQNDSSYFEHTEKMTHELEWRINNLSELVAHVEGPDGGGEQGKRGDSWHSPSEVLRDGKRSVDQFYKFDLGVYRG